MRTHSSNCVAGIIPALNEEATIGEVVRSLKSVADMIFVVDDGSDDATGEEAQRAGAIVIRHEHPYGYDQSIEDGFKRAVQSGAVMVFTSDADLQHQPSDVERVLAPLLAGVTDVSTGVRDHMASFGEKLYMLYTKLRFGVADPLCGLKAYKSDIYIRYGSFSRLNSVGTELLLRAVRDGYRLKEVPITVMPRSDTSRFYSKKIRANVRIMYALLKVIIFI